MKRLLIGSALLIVALVAQPAEAQRTRTGILYSTAPEDAPDSLVLAQPLEGRPVRGEIFLEWPVDQSADTIVFYLDGEPVEYKPTFTPFDTRRVRNGPHWIRSVATYPDGSTYTIEARFIVANRGRP